MGRIAQGAEKKCPAECQLPAPPRQPVKRAGAEQPAGGNEREGVRELPVIFEEQQRVGPGTDKDIEVRGRAGGEPQNAGDARMALPARGLRQCGAESALCQRIHPAATPA